MEIHPYHESTAFEAGCIDGRAGALREQSKEYLADVFKTPVDDVQIDLQTLPGMLGKLANDDSFAWDLVRESARISNTAHGSTTFLISGHHDCAGHPVSDSQQRDDLRKVMEMAQERLENYTRFITLFYGPEGIEILEPTTKNWRYQVMEVIQGEFQSQAA